MKKLINTLFFATLISSSAVGQEKVDYISLNSENHSNDTTYIFHVNSKNYDFALQKLIIYWGNPNVNTAGEIAWFEKEIPNLNKELIIQLSDKLCTNKKRFLECKTFSNEKDKAEKLQSIKPNQFRSITITITDKGKKNAINNVKNAKEIELFLEDIIAAN